MTCFTSNFCLSLIRTFFPAMEIEDWFYSVHSNEDDLRQLESRLSNVVPKLHATIVPPCHKHIMLERSTFSKTIVKISPVLLWFKW